MKMRKSRIKRDTKETQIKLTLDIDGTGEYDIRTDCGFLKHMLELFARHGRFDLTVDCTGDSYVDYHHTVEDTGICLGQAFNKALGDKKGIKRYGSMILPMDEALLLCSLDISGRSFVNYDVMLTAMKVSDESEFAESMKVGDFDTELVKEFMLALSREIGMTLHIKMLEGENTHHIIEGIFKCLARALAHACEIDRQFADEIPSTKGVL